VCFVVAAFTQKIEVLYKLRTYNNKTAAPPNTANRKNKKKP